MAHLKGNDLIAIGFTPGKALGMALSIASTHYRHEHNAVILNDLKVVLEHPEDFIKHAVFGKLADTLIPKVDLTKKDLNMDDGDND